MIRSIVTGLAFFVMGVGLLSACATLLTPATYATQQPSANAIPPSLPPPSPTLALWQMQATGEAAATSAAAISTEIAEATRLERERAATATQARIGTLEAASLTPAAATALAMQLTLDYQRSQATRQAAQTADADAFAATATREQATAMASGTLNAAVLTQAFNNVQATEATRREQFNSNMANSVEAIKPLSQICWGLLLPLAFGILLWWVFGVARADVNRRRAASVYLDTPLGPAWARHIEGGQIEIILLNPPAQARAAISERAHAQGAPPVRPKVEMSPMGIVARSAPSVSRPANDSLRDEILNLLREAVDVNGEGSTQIPRYNSLPSFARRPRRWQRLTDVLVHSGYCTKVDDAGRDSGTFLAQGLTLYGLLTKITNGALLSPIQTTLTPAEGGDTLPATQRNAE